MSLKPEKLNALKRTREFMRKLLSPYDGGYKRVPKEVRLEARSCLRHYPPEFDVKIRNDDGTWPKEKK